MTELSESVIRDIDSENMWDLLVAFPDYWDEAIAFTANLDLNIDKSMIKNILISGMGSSSIAGDLIKAYAAPFSRVPVEVIRHYELPAWVDEHTLFIACSYSGDTEETLFFHRRSTKKESTDYMYYFRWQDMGKSKT